MPPTACSNPSRRVTWPLAGAWALGVFFTMMLAATTTHAGDGGELPQNLLTPGKPLISPGMFQSDRLAIKGGQGATVAWVPVTGQSFDLAWRIEVSRRFKSFYHVEIKYPTAFAIQRDDVCLLTFWARTTANQDESGEGMIRAYFQSQGPRYNKSLMRAVRVGPQWRRYDLPFKTKQAYPAGGANLCFGFGDAIQTVEIGGMSLQHFGKEVDMDSLPRTRPTYAGREPDAPWRTEAEARIEQIRKADLTVRVVDALGKPVPGARVKIRQRSHRFVFGTAVNIRMVNDDSPDGETYREKLVEWFNHATPENALKWPVWSGDRGSSHSPETTDKAIRWLRSQGLHIKGHNLVWPGRQYLPGAIREALEQPDLDTEALRETVRRRVTEMATRYRGLVHEWDVVNEPFNNHDLMDVLGDDEMTRWFELAKAADPKAVLYLNDFGILAAAGRTDTPHQAHFEQTIKDLLDRGAPLEAIGIQGHFGETVTPPVTVLELLDRYAVFGLPIQITEYDLNSSDPQLQADYMRDFMTAVFSHPSVNGFILWGFWEGAHWRPDAAMFTRDWQPKAHAKAYREMVYNRWWTNIQGTTDPRGLYVGRGFMGEYDVIVSTMDGESNASFRLAPGGAVIQITLNASH